MGIRLSRVQGIIDEAGDPLDRLIPQIILIRSYLNVLGMFQGKALNPKEEYF